MERRDLLKDQIEQLGRVLSKILSDFIGTKSKGNVAQGIEISNERLQNELDINIKKLISLNNIDLKTYLNTRKLTEPHLEILSKYLVENGKTKTDKDEMELYLKKAIILLNLADEISKTMSFERTQLKNEITSML